MKNRARRAFDPIGAALAAMGVPPLLVSFIGLAIALYGASLVAEGRLAYGGLLLLVSGLCDVLDGDLARRQGTVTRFGAFVDSTLDRVSEFAYFGGIILYVVSRPAGFSDYEIAVALAALAGSVLTSYARARAEGIGVECRLGLMERPERVVLLALGLLLGYRILVVAMTVLALTTLLTFVQRVVHVYRRAGAQPPG